MSNIVHVVIDQSPPANTYEWILLIIQFSSSIIAIIVGIIAILSFQKEKPNILIMFEDWKPCDNNKKKCLLIRITNIGRSPMIIRYIKYKYLEDIQMRGEYEIYERRIKPKIEMSENNIDEHNQIIINDNESKCLIIYECYTNVVYLRFYSIIIEDIRGRSISMNKRELKKTNTEYNKPGKIKTVYTKYLGDLPLYLRVLFIFLLFPMLLWDSLKYLLTKKRNRKLK
jgi:hypothetical protein